MQIFVKKPCGHTVTVEVPKPAAAHSVAWLKLVVAELTSIPAETFRLVSASQQLERDKLTLYDYGIRAGSTIDIQLRIAGGGRMMKLYHQTDPDGFRGIKRIGGLRKGASGLAGPGMYFATTPEHTSHKARRRGVILEALVDIGDQLRISADGCADAEDRMRAADCHSVLIPRSNGHEYCVYDSWRVTITRYHADGHWQEFDEEAAAAASAGESASCSMEERADALLAFLKRCESSTSSVTIREIRQAIAHTSQLSPITATLFCRSVATLLNNCKHSSMKNRRSILDFSRFNLRGDSYHPPEDMMSSGRKIEAAGGVPVIIDLLSRLPDKANVVVSACIAMYALARNESDTSKSIRATLRRSDAATLLQAVSVRLAAMGCKAERNIAALALKELDLPPASRETTQTSFAEWLEIMRTIEEDKK